MRRAVIFNADDFGLTEGVNAGIIGAYRHGLVRSTSLMVTTPGFDDAVALSRAHPGLDLGVHLALTGVWPLLPPAQIPSLVGRDGRFPPLAAWLRRLACGQLRPAEVAAELRAQLLRACTTGLPFTHLEGHHHVHLFGPVAAIVGELAREFGIPVVRRVRSRRGASDGAGPAPGATSPKGLLLAGADLRWGGAAFAGLPRTDAFRGVVFPADLAGWARLVRSCPPGTTEIMCHPGLYDPAVGALDGYIAEREQELRWLCDARVRALFVGAGIAITSFGALLERSWAGAVAPPGVPPQVGS